MLFNSYHFFIFLAILLLLTNLVKWRSTAQKIILLLGCYYFYGQWSWPYLGLILVTTTVDFLVALKIYERYHPRTMLLLSLLINLGILGFFKYANFLLSTANGLSASLGSSWHLTLFDVMLPIGISFYTFQSLSYVMDVSRGEFKARRNFLDYALFVAFFTHLAGPIIRARKFFDQLDAGTKPSFNEVQSGVSLIIFGLVKKIVFADNLAAFASPIFDSPSGAGGLETLLGIYAFTFQIYFDFSGYSDMAVGVSKFFGFTFPKNFDYPYISTSFQEFWRRWHISLSTWLRDYLYISLGGSRLGSLRHVGNLLATMLIGGLWHGASWNFVLWGGLHGFYLVAERGVRSVFPALMGSRSYPVVAARWFFVFNLTALTWVFFRSPGFSDSMRIFGNLTMLAEGVRIETLLLIGALLGFFMGIHWIASRIEWKERLTDMPAYVLIAAYTLALLGLIIFNPQTSPPFIYFKF